MGHHLLFKDFNLDSDLLTGINSMGFTKPTPVQEKAIPVILQHKDLIACAQTGTGKTAAFVLPLLHKIMQLPADGIHSLVLVPTRELAIQIDQQIDAISYFIDVRSMAIYGGGSGQSWVKQKKALTSGVDMIIATPGRLMAQMKMGGIDFSKLKHLVLDEADRMMDMGFYDDIIKIVGQLPKKHQTLCFSATMPPKIRALSKNILHHPQEISIAIAKPAAGIQQLIYSADDKQKLKLVAHILKKKRPQSVIIFASRKTKVKEISQRINKLSIPATDFHSDLEQEQREALMQDFKSHRISVLVGTDILSRGIDVEGIDMIINFDVPSDAEDYVHRVGRTARADKTGTAITLVNNEDQWRLSKIEKLIGSKLKRQQLPKGFQQPPQFHADRPNKNKRRKNQSNRNKKSFKKKGGSKNSSKNRQQYKGKPKKED